MKFIGAHVSAAGGFIPLPTMNVTKYKMALE